MKLTYKIINNKYNTILEVLKEHFSISDRLLKKLKKLKLIYLNSNPILSINTPITINDVIDVDLDYQEDNSNIVPTQMNLDIIYEDAWLLILNKPAHIAIHPSINHYTTSLSNGVRYYFDSINLHKKIRPVNRLDKDTSGIVIFAKSEYIQEQLSKQMQTKKIKKEYISILTGIVTPSKGTINAPISRKPNSIIEREVNINGDNSITHYNVIKTLNNNLSVVSFILETGRTHQIRVHSSYINHPILGDTLYGMSSKLIDRQALHAIKITFIHPITNKILFFIAPIPDDIKNIINNYK